LKIKYVGNLIHLFTFEKLTALGSAINFSIVKITKLKYSAIEKLTALRSAVSLTIVKSITIKKLTALRSAVSFVIVNQILILSR